MSVETIIETAARPTIGSNLTGTLDAIVAGATAVVGTLTNFDPEVSVGDILTFLDTAGARRYYTVKTVTDDTNIVLTNPVATASSGGINFQIATPKSPYIIGDDQSDTFAVAPNELPIYNDVFGNSLVAVNPFNPGTTELKFISVDEGALIKSIYVRYPYQYTGSARNLSLRMFQTNSSGSSTLIISQFGSSGLFPLPIENIEVPVNIYIPPFNPNGGENWSIDAEVFGAPQNQETAGAGFGSVDLMATLSSVDDPDALDNEFMPVIIGMRIVTASSLLAA